MTRTEYDTLIAEMATERLQDSYAESRAEIAALATDVAPFDAELARKLGTLLAMVDEMKAHVCKRHAETNAPVVLHYRTQQGQGYGSESRKCSECGIMVWLPPVPEWTDERAVWLTPPPGYVNCRQAKECSE